MFAAEIVSKTIIHIALGYVGVQYVWGGQTDQGVDCSGLIIQVFRKLPGFQKFPDMTANDLYHNIFTLKSGDLAASFHVEEDDRANHIALLVGDGIWLEASGISRDVRLTSLNTGDVTRYLSWPALLAHYGEGVVAQQPSR